jgi:hypothetical protein
MDSDYRALPSLGGVCPSFAYRVQRRNSRPLRRVVPCVRADQPGRLGPRSRVVLLPGIVPSSFPQKEARTKPGSVHRAVDVDRTLGECTPTTTKSSGHPICDGYENAMDGAWPAAAEEEEEEEEEEER